MITFSLQHGRTGAVARQRLATTVDEVRRRGGALVQHVTWSADHTQVRLGGYWVAMRVDAQAGSPRRHRPPRLAVRRPRTRGGTPAYRSPPTTHEAFPGIFLSEIQRFLAVGAVRLWTTLRVAQAPVVNAKHCPSGRQIHQPKIMSYDTIRTGPYWSRAALR